MRGLRIWDLIDQPYIANKERD